jgi:hypothetical protein
MFLSVTGTKNFMSIFLSKSTSAFRVAIYFLSFTSDKTQSLSKCINEASEAEESHRKEREDLGHLERKSQLLLCYVVSRLGPALRVSLRTLGIFPQDLCLAG